MRYCIRFACVTMVNSVGLTAVMQHLEGVPRGNSELSLRSGTYGQLVATLLLASGPSCTPGTVWPRRGDAQALKTAMRNAPSLDNMSLDAKRNILLSAPVDAKDANGIPTGAARSLYLLPLEAVAVLAARVVVDIYGRTMARAVEESDKLKRIVSIDVVYNRLESIGLAMGRSLFCVTKHLLQRILDPGLEYIDSCVGASVSHALMILSIADDCFDAVPPLDGLSQQLPIDDGNDAVTIPAELLEGLLPVPLAYAQLPAFLASYGSSAVVRICDIKNVLVGFVLPGYEAHMCNVICGFGPRSSGGVSFDYQCLRSAPPPQSEGVHKGIGCPWLVNVFVPLHGGQNSLAIVSIRAGHLPACIADVKWLALAPSVEQILLKGLTGHPIPTASLITEASAAAIAARESYRASHAALVSTGALPSEVVVASARSRNSALDGTVPTFTDADLPSCLCGQSGSSDHIGGTWVQCESEGVCRGSLNGWYHLSCLGQKVVPEIFKCTSCVLGLPSVLTRVLAVPASVQARELSTSILAKLRAAISTDSLQGKGGDVADAVTLDSEIAASAATRPATTVETELVYDNMTLLAHVGLYTLAA